jgi:predicted acylesterase/phospholipase RssA
MTDNLSPGNNTQLRRSLEQSRIFGDLGSDLIIDLVNSMTIKVVSGGEQVLAQGDKSDSLLVLISGRLLALRQLPDGTSQRLAEIGPGSTVGEIGLVLQQPRAADIVAIRDSSVASLAREEFEQLLKRHPVEFNRAITRTLYEYTNLPNNRPKTLGATTFAIVPLDKHIDTTQLCEGISKALSHYGKTRHLNPKEGEAFHTDSGASMLSNKRLHELEECHDYLLYQASAEATPWSKLAIRQADQLILVANSDTPPDMNASQKDILCGPGFDMIRKSLVLLHPETVEKPTVDLGWNETFDLERLYPLRQTLTADIQRLVRFITDRAIGLVLGGGGARGMAHIGVLRALHESGIPVDMVCGNSMGALIGAQYIHGTPIDDLLRTTSKFARGGEHPALPLISLLSGKRIQRDIKRMFGESTLEGQWRPFFPVSCNLSHANIKIHDQGPLWQAVLASNSPAGIVPPVVLDGDLLVDAALLDNVPVRAMREKLGFGTLIAVDVDVSEELTVDPALKELSGWQVLRQRLFGRNEARLPGIIDVLNRSGHLGGLTHREASKKLADYYLQPPVSHFALMGYGRGKEIADTGYQYAIAQIKDWALIKTLDQTVSDDSI